MATLTIRNVDDQIVVELKARAKTNNRSLEAELREILAMSIRRGSKDALLALADRIAAMTPEVAQSDSTQLLREDRDR